MADPIIGGALLSGGAKLLGGLFGNSSAKSEARRSRDWAADQAVRQKQWEEHMARHSTGWQFEDLMRSADEAGIHRLAALGGAQSYGVSNSMAQSEPASQDFGFLGDAIGEGVASMERSRAFKASQAATAQSTKESNARIAVDNAQAELLKSQSRTLIKRARAETTSGPANQPNPLNDRLDPSNYYQTSGPYKGSYVIPIGGKNHIVDGHSAPKEVIEAILGEVPSELSAIYETGRASTKTVKRPKSRSDRPSSNTDRPSWSNY